MDGLLWKTPLPSGLSCPVLFGDQIFLTGYEKNRLVTLALDGKSGKVIWKKNAPKVEIERFHASGSPATPTPFVERDRLFVYFGSFPVCSAMTMRVRNCGRNRLPLAEPLRNLLLSHCLRRDADSGDGRRRQPTRQQSEPLPYPRAEQEKRQDSLGKTPSLSPQRMVHPNPGKGFPRMELVVLGNGSLRGTLFRTERKMAGRRLFQETIARPMTGNGKVYASGSRLGGSADLNADPLPFWKAVIGFDANGDGRLERKEMTGHFTFPFRPQLPPGAPRIWAPLATGSGKEKSPTGGNLSENGQKPGRFLGQGRIHRQPDHRTR